jgi:hypothetical protein
MMSCYEIYDVMLWNLMIYSCEINDLQLWSQNPTAMLVYDVICVIDDFCVVK